MTTTHREMRISHPPGTGMLRPPWVQWVLGIVTLGIHAAFQHFRINRELRDFGIEVDPAKALLAFFPGGLILIPYLVTHYRTGERIAVAQETVGLAPTAQPELSALACLFALLHIPYQQSELNRVWAVDLESRAS